jgi:soluble lytic murein transglycosylase
MMSSMWRAAVIVAVLLATAPSSSAQYAVPGTGVAAPGTSQSIASTLESWRALRQSNGYRFADYASFLIANPDWPDATRMRGWAEKAMQPGENAGTVLAFFAAEKPKTGNGWARLAEAYASSGQSGPALDAARHAWSSPDLSGPDEQAIWSHFGSSLTRADSDARVDALLFAKRPDDAARFLSMTTPERQAAFAARIAMQQNASDADSRYRAVMGSVTSDAGLMMDRLRYLRANNSEAAAQQLAAREHKFTTKPADAERFMDMLIELAGEAQGDRNWRTAFDIASQSDDLLPAGTKPADQPMAIRDDYTTLAWLAGSVALDRMNRPSDALSMFYSYASGGRSLQVKTKGYYWAGRAALASGHLQDANAYFQSAAAYPELFYGQLALERLARVYGSAI